MSVFNSLISALRRKKSSVADVHVIIPTAGSPLWMLRRCLRNLRKAGRGIRIRVIVVLCPADPEKEKAIHSMLAPTDTLLSLLPPFSFARSNNAALALLKEEQYVLFLNDDCFFRKSGDLLRLMSTIQSERLAYTGPWLEHWQCKEELPVEERTDGVVRTSSPLIGACFLCDSRWLNTTGFFDTSFDGYGMEEADLSLRMLLQGGRWARDDRIVVDHIHHATVGESIKSQEPHLRNLRRWQEKYPDIHSWGAGQPWQTNLNVPSPLQKTEAHCAPV